MKTMRTEFWEKLIKYLIRLNFKMINIKSEKVELIMIEHSIPVFSQRSSITE